MYEMFQNNNFLLRLGHEYYPDLEQADVIFISEIAVNCERTLVKQNYFSLIFPMKTKIFNPKELRQFFYIPKDAISQLMIDKGYTDDDTP